MKISFFINKLCDNELNHSIFKCLNELSEDDNITDASLFFVNVGPTSHPIKFGMFNSTDVWNYDGNLISTSLQGVKYLQGVTNKIKLAYLFSKENNTLALISVSKDTPILVTTDKDRDEVFRLTGVSPTIISLTPQGLSEYFNDNQRKD